MKRFEEEYRKYMTEKTPDLWDRIDQALPEKKEAEQAEKSQVQPESIVSFREEKRKAGRRFWRNVISAAAGICVLITVRFTMNVTKSARNESMTAPGVYKESVDDNVQNEVEKPELPEASSEKGINEESAAEADMETNYTEEVDKVMNNAAEARSAVESAAEADMTMKNAAEAGSAEESAVEADMMTNYAAEADMAMENPVSVLKEVSVCPWDKSMNLAVVTISATDIPVNIELLAEPEPEFEEDFRCINNKENTGDLKIIRSLSPGEKCIVLYTFLNPGKEKEDGGGQDDKQNDKQDEKQNEKQDEKPGEKQYEKQYARLQLSIQQTFYDNVEDMDNQDNQDTQTGLINNEDKKGTGKTITFSLTDADWTENPGIVSRDAGSDIE